MDGNGGDIKDRQRMASMVATFRQGARRRRKEEEKYKQTIQILETDDGARV